MTRRPSARAFEQHERAVYASALRILGNPAQAQDVVQDVFMRVWRRPGAFDARRGDLASYLRLMARSRALDLWREGQAAGRASDRLKVVVEAEPATSGDSPAAAAEADATQEAVFEALQDPPRAAARRARARLLGRPDRRARSPIGSRSRSAPPRAGSASALRGCDRNVLHWR